MLPSQGLSTEYWLLVMIEKQKNLWWKRNFRHWPVKSLQLHSTRTAYQKTKFLWFWFDINNFYSPREIKILGPPWCPSEFYFRTSFLIIVADLFYSNYNLDFPSYVDDTTPNICGQDFSVIVKKINFPTGSDKMVLLQTQARVTYGKKHELVIASSSSKELTFHDHITRLC